jgi:hypothetical protein
MLRLGVFVNTTPKRFCVALSFPGEKRPFVETTAELLAKQLGRERVLYDKFHEAEFARPNLDDYLQRLYHDESDLVVVFVCEDYERKEWCGLEWRAIRDLIKSRRISALMFFRFDDTTIPGLFGIDGYVSLRGRSPVEAARLIFERLNCNLGASLLNPGASARASGLGFALIERPELQRRVTSVLDGCAGPTWKQLFGIGRASEPKTCVLFGPSGFGKTTLARAVYQSWSSAFRTWIDADQPYLQRPPSSHKHLVVVDRLDTAALEWLTENSWLCDIHNPLLLLTSQVRTRDSILKIRPCRRANTVTIEEIAGFNEAESDEFVRARLLPQRKQFVSDTLVKRINRAVSGCPLIWQLIIDIVNEGQGDCFELFSSDSQEDDANQVFDDVFRRWFHTLPALSSSSRQCLTVLCCVSMIGANVRTLAFLLETSERELRDCLRPLIAKGLLQHRDDGSVIPHALLRSACARLKKELICVPNESGNAQSCAITTEHVITRYRAYLDDQLTKKRIDRSDIFSVLDAWLVALREAFNYPEGRLEEFASKYFDITDRLEPLFERGELQPVHHEWLAGFLKDQGIDLTCSSLIALAQVVRRIKPRNAVLANILWKFTEPSAKHGDSWALIEIISAAGLQFSEQGEQIAQAGFSKALDVLRHWQRALEQNKGYFDSLSVDCEPTSEPPSDDSQDDHALDRNLIGLCFGGLSCLLLKDRSIVFWGNQQFTKRFPSAMLAVILHAADRKDTTVLQALTPHYWKIVPPSGDSILAAIYLRSIGLELTKVGECLNDEVIEVSPLHARIAGRMAFADKFVSFVEQVSNGPHGSGRFGPIKVNRDEI